MWIDWQFFEQHSWNIFKSSCAQSGQVSFKSVVLNLMQIFRCSQKQCNGRGRCRAKNILPPLKCELAYQPETICICDEGFMGEHCELLQSSVIPQTQIEINDLSTPLTTTPLEIEDQTSPLRITPSPSTTPTISKFLKYSSFCIFFLKKSILYEIPM